MGFISDDKLVVDAVVTKVGRTMLAENNFFPVKFALADDEVDYNLWDETHPQGPDFYGAIIDNMRIFIYKIIYICLNTYRIISQSTFN